LTQNVLWRKTLKHMEKKSEFLEGIKVGVPVAVGYIPIAVAFGLLARSFAIPNEITIVMSLLIYAGASQFIGINLLVLGASYSEIVITTFILNLRHFLMTAALSQKIETEVSKKWRALLAFGITDETFTVGVLRNDKNLSKYFILGLNTIAYFSWNAGTWIGLFLAPSLPDVLKASMGTALYAMFIGLLVPNIRKSRPVLVVSCMAIAINSLLSCLPIFAGVSNGWGIIIATVMSAAVGACLYPEGVKKT
jgi:4-azaleucine resistance transporter AzlC